MKFGKLRHLVPALLAVALACGGESSSSPQQTQKTQPPPPPPPPSNLPAGLHASRSPGEVVLTWQSAAGATSYQVTAIDGRGSTQVLGTTILTGAEVFFTANGDVLPLVTFKVQALGGGLTNPPASVDVPAPPLPVLAAVAHHRVLLTWPFDPVAGHAAIVQRSSDIGVTSEVGSSVTESFEDRTFTDGILYTYSVKISTAQLDLFSRPVTASFPTAAPQDVIAVPDNEGVLLSWTPVEGQFTGRISASDTPGGPYTVVAEGVSSPFVAGCGFATTCYFVVTSVARNGNAGGTSVEVNSRRRPFPPDATAHSLVGAVAIDFPTRPADAQSFIISRSNGIAGPFEEIGRTSDLKFVDTTGVTWVPYWYQVQSTNGQSVSVGAVTNAARSTEPPDQQSIDTGGPGEVFTTLEDVDQSFTAGSSGQLMGIEVLGDFSQGQSMSLRLFDGQTELANVAPWNHMFLNWSGPLASGEVLGLYYDLSSFGIPVSSGQTLRFEMSVPSNLGFGDVVLAGGTYPGGTAFLDGAAVPSWDLVFKTFVHAGTQLTAPAPLETVGGTQAVSLRWPASPGAIEYRVGRSDSPGGAKTLIQSTQQTTFVDAGLSSSATYYYQVIAVAADGREVSSQEQIAQVLPLVVDQANLADQPGGAAFLVSADSTVDRFASQVVTVGKPGLLVGLELSALGFPTLRLRVFDDRSGSQLGSADYDLAIFGGIRPHPLLPALIGPGFLDLTPLGLQVAAGDRLRFEVTTPPLDSISHFFWIREDGTGALAFKTFVQ